MKFSLSRSITIYKSPADILPLLTDFTNWKQWSPWSIIEPDHKVTFTGQTSGIGSKMMWEGEIIGSGALEIEEVSASNIKYDLQFFKPYKSKAKTQFLVQEKNGETEVTWTMQSSMPWFLFFMIPMMKSWIEMDYDRGLTMLKASTEEGHVNATTTNEGVVDFEGFSYVGLQKTSNLENMPTEMGAAFEKLMKDMKNANNEAKHWVGIYPKVNMKKKLFTYIAAASYEQKERIDSLEPEYTTGEIQSGKMLKITHRGSYKFLGNAWSMGMMYVQAKKMKKCGNPFEYYHNSPHDTAEEDLITDIYFPVKS